jgi:hypothetical protein
MDMEKRILLPLLGFKPWIIQPIASCYTNYVILAHSLIEVQSKNLPGWIEGIATMKNLLGCWCQFEDEKQAPSEYKSSVGSIR